MSEAADPLPGYDELFTGAARAHSEHRALAGLLLHHRGELLRCVTGALLLVGEAHGVRGYGLDVPDGGGEAVLEFVVGIDGVVYGVGQPEYAGIALDPRTPALLALLADSGAGDMVGTYMVGALPTAGVHDPRVIEREILSAVRRQIHSGAGG